MESERSGGCYINGRKVSAKTFLICLPMVILVESIGRGLMRRMEDDCVGFIARLLNGR